MHINKKEIKEKRESKEGRKKEKQRKVHTQMSQVSIVPNNAFPSSQLFFTSGTLSNIHLNLIPLIKYCEDKGEYERKKAEIKFRK